MAMRVAIPVRSTGLTSFDCQFGTASAGFRVQRQPWVPSVSSGHYRYFSSIYDSQTQLRSGAFSNPAELDQDHWMITIAEWPLSDELVQQIADWVDDCRGSGLPADMVFRYPPYLVWSTSGPLHPYRSVS